MPVADTIPVTIPQRLCQAIRQFRAGDDTLLRHLLRACQPDVHFLTTDACPGAPSGDDPTLVCQRPGLTVGIDPTGDITGCCAAIGLALFGPLWPNSPEMLTVWNILHAEARTAARQRREAKAHA